MFVLKTDLGYMYTEDGEIKFSNDINRARKFSEIEVEAYNDSIVDDLRDFTKAKICKWIRFEQ